MHDNLNDFWIELSPQGEIKPFHPRTLELFLDPVSKVCVKTQWKDRRACSFPRVPTYRLPLIKVISVNSVFKATIAYFSVPLSYTDYPTADRNQCPTFEMYNLRG
jgi:hypothetical protein